MMRIAIVGLGGVGAYIGAKLSALKDEHEIIFLARGEHLKEIKEHGLRMIDVNEEKSYYPTSASQTASRHLDIVFLCTKSYQSKEALKGLSNSLSESTIIIPVSNGVDNKEELQPLTSARVFDACVYIVSHLIKPGLVKKSTDIFALVLPMALQEETEALLLKAGLRHKFSSDIKKELWKKFLFISAMGTMTSYYGIGMGSVYKQHTKELEGLLNEIYGIARAEGILLEPKAIDKAMETASKLPLDAPTSLWLDLKKGKGSELESLSHYLIKKAKEHGIETPIMQKIYERLR